MAIEATPHLINEVRDVLVPIAKSQQRIEFMSDLDLLHSLGLLVEVIFTVPTAIVNTTRPSGKLYTHSTSLWSNS